MVAGEVVGIASGDSFGADLVGVNDVAAGLLLAVEQRLDGVFNLSSGVRTTIGGAAREIVRLAGLDAALVRIEAETGDADIGFPAVDCTPLKSFGYSPTELGHVLAEIIDREAAARG